MKQISSLDGAGFAVDGVALIVQIGDHLSKQFDVS